MTEPQSVLPGRCRPPVQGPGWPWWPPRKESMASGISSPQWDCRPPTWWAVEGPSAIGSPSPPDGSAGVGGFTSPWVLLGPQRSGCLACVCGHLLHPGGHQGYGRQFLGSKWAGWDRPNGHSSARPGGPLGGRLAKAPPCEHRPRDRDSQACTPPQCPSRAGAIRAKMDFWSTRSSTQTPGYLGPRLGVNVRKGAPAGPGGSGQKRAARGGGLCPMCVHGSPVGEGRSGGLRNPPEPHVRCLVPKSPASGHWPTQARAGDPSGSVTERRGQCSRSSCLTLKEAGWQPVPHGGRVPAPSRLLSHRVLTSRLPGLAGAAPRGVEGGGWGCPGRAGQ